MISEAVKDFGSGEWKYLKEKQMCTFINVCGTHSILTGFIRLSFPVLKNSLFKQYHLQNIHTDQVSESASTKNDWKSLQQCTIQLHLYITA